MTRLLVLVEGQSEEVFVKRSLATHLQQFGVYVQSPKILWTKRLASGGGYRGGVSTWRQVKRDLTPLLRDGRAWVTTVIDFYGLPKDFPGASELKDIADPQARVQAAQSRFASEIKHERFIPFFALHELEAWIFSHTGIVQDHYGKPLLSDRLSSVVHEAGSPEQINHGPTTHPKARLRDLVGGYKETSDGPTLLEKIGIERIRLACPHFNRWLSRLESLGA